MLEVAVPDRIRHSSSHIKNITVLTEVYPECQKANAVIVEYDCILDNATIALTSFSVIDQFETELYPEPAALANGGVIYSPRTIINAYVNDAPYIAAHGRNGKYVILELDPMDSSAPCIYLTGAHRACRTHIKPVNLLVNQLMPLFCVDGQPVPPSEGPFLNNGIRNNIVDDYICGNFNGLNYSLFIPRDYNSSQEYPLVCFVADSWALGDDSRISLAQGYGGVIWAHPEEQAKRPCFVLVPQFAGPTIVEDDFSVNDEELEKEKQLIDYITETYSVDCSRIYYTGQSMGYLSGCELNIRYPHLFAASLLISGFWNPDTMFSLSNQNIWMIISAGDGHAYGTMSQAVSNMVSVGSNLGRYDWDAAESLESINQKVRDAMQDEKKVRFSVFKAGSMLSDTLLPYGDHRATWMLGYQLDSLREWLFNQRKES